MQTALLDDDGYSAILTGVGPGFSHLTLGIAAGRAPFDITARSLRRSSLQKKYTVQVLEYY